MAKKKTKSQNTHVHVEMPESLARYDEAEEPPQPSIGVPHVDSFFTRSCPHIHDFESISNASLLVNDLWDITAGDTYDHLNFTPPRIDSPLLFRWSSDYRLDDRSLDIREIKSGDVSIAVANFFHLRQCWTRILSFKCWKTAKTYPSAETMLHLILRALGDPDGDILFCWDRVVAPKAIKHLERSRAHAISIITPTMCMFQASLSAMDSRMPSNRVKPRRCANRDLEFVSLFGSNKSCKEIMAIWNSHNPNAQVSEETVRQAISRYRKKT